MTVEQKEFRELHNMLAGSGISCRFLKSQGDRAILYLYRERELQEYLMSEEIVDFLHSYGYRGEGLDGMLEQLSDRIYMFENKESSFPHEIGIFLGYPLADVLGFIKNKGRNYLYAGYWKVYGNVREAKRIFCQYDMEREQTFLELSEGKTLEQMIRKNTKEVYTK